MILFCIFRRITMLNSIKFHFMQEKKAEENAHAAEEN